MKAVIYARVSTDDQDTERQVYELIEFGKKEGYDDVRFFAENITGKKDANYRKSFAEMMDYIEENNIKQIYSWELNRLGRTVRDISANVHFFRNQGINLYIKKENINTRNNDANTQFQLNILASMAEFELETIKARTLSGTYYSIRKGGTGGGAIKQYGYKKENGKLVIDVEEAAVIVDICDKYLHKDWSVKQIADYLNEIGIETRYRKLINSGEITYKVASDLVWTDGSVARLLHKRLLTGFRTYGKVELQDEALRIISNETFDSIQIKMDEKRKSKANSQKYEHILRGTLICGNCGSSMIMQKSKSGLQNHYQCFKRFTKKDKSCNSAMINIDLLNNLVYKKVKDFKVASKDIEAKIKELNSKILKNNISIKQITKELQGISKAEENLVDLYIKELIKITIYQERLKDLQVRESEAIKKQKDIEALNLSIQEQIKVFESKKIVDLTNPEVFKSNARELIESIEVKNLKAVDMAELKDEFSQHLGEEVDFSSYKIEHKGRERIYLVNIRMYDNRTVYKTLTKSTFNYGETIKVEKINPQDKNKGILKKRISKPVDYTFSLRY